MPNDGLRLFQREEQEQALTAFLARLFCYEVVAPCTGCMDSVGGTITERAYEAIGAALIASNVTFSQRARFWGLLQTAAVTMTPNDREEEE